MNNSGNFKKTALKSASNMITSNAFMYCNVGNPNYLQLGGLSLSGSGNIANGNNANNNSSAVVNNNPNGYDLILVRRVTCADAFRCLNVQREHW